MISPPRWTEKQLAAQRLAAIAAFRAERMGEPLEKYIAVFDRRREDVARLLERLVDMIDVNRLDDEAILSVLCDAQLLDAFRYLSGPPVSTDDLKTTTGVPSLAPATLRGDPATARTVFRTVLQGLDCRRFPWVAEKREPTKGERYAALVASAALMATQRAATDRRNEGKTAQEGAVFQALRDIRFHEVQARRVDTLDDAPAPGEFCSESLLGGRKADIVVRLHDRRVLAIECKVSNSSVNSIKRLDNDFVAKAKGWSNAFGTRQLLPSAMLSGVFHLSHLIEVQDQGLTIFWAHDLPNFQKWVKRARR